MKIPRRHLLGASVGIVASQATAVDGDERQSSDWIDAHVHVWTPDTDSYPNADGKTRKGLRSSFTPDELFVQCRPHGVTRIVLIQMSFYQFDNSYMLHVMDKHPGVFAGVAVIDESATGLARRMRELNGRGVRGFRVYANAKNAATWEASSSEMQSMWREAAENDQAICCLTDPDALGSITRLCRKHPQTSIVIDHFARIGMRGEIDQQHLEQLLKLSEFKHVHVKTSAFYALGKKSPPYDDLAPMIRSLRDAYGADRLMWASDCPFQVEGQHSYAASIGLIRDRLNFLDDAETQAILRDTAERVFFS